MLAGFDLIYGRAIQERKFSGYYYVTKGFHGRRLSEGYDSHVGDYRYVYTKLGIDVTVALEFSLNDYVNF